MSLPPHPPTDGFHRQDADAQPAVVWGPPPGWTPPSPAAALPPAGPPQPAGIGRTWVLVLVAVAAFLAGAAGAGLLATVLFVVGAEDIGRGMGEEFSTSLEDTMGWMAEGGVGTAGPVEEFPAVAPGVLGPDPVLNAYAASCFEGELGACDDLYYQAPPMSDYEEYAGTCGGRVKLFALVSCTDLE
jgi:hypothetical protein